MHEGVSRGEKDGGRFSKKEMVWMVGGRKLGERLGL